jgi:hypothetical protein
MGVRVRLFAAVVCVAAGGSIGGMLIHIHSWVIGSQALWVLPFVLAMLTGIAKTTTV